MTYPLPFKSKKFLFTNHILMTRSKVFLMPDLGENEERGVRKKQDLVVFLFHPAVLPRSAWNVPHDIFHYHLDSI